jgi:hypothetical protein
VEWREGASDSRLPTDLAIHGVDGDVECRVVPLHLLSVVHVDLDRTALGRADARDAEDDEEHEETDADDGDHRDSSARRLGTGVP